MKYIVVENQNNTSEEHYSDCKLYPSGKQYAHGEMYHFQPRIRIAFRQPMDDYYMCSNSDGCKYLVVQNFPSLHHELRKIYQYGKTCIDKSKGIQTIAKKYRDSITFLKLSQAVRNIDSINSLVPHDIPHGQMIHPAIDIYGIFLNSDNVLYLKFEISEFKVKYFSILDAL